MSDPTSQEPSKAQEFSRGYGPTDKRFAYNLDWVKKASTAMIAARMTSIESETASLRAQLAEANKTVKMLTR